MTNHTLVVRRITEELQCRDKRQNLLVQTTLPVLAKSEIWWLEVGYPLLDEITIWVKDDDIEELMLAGDSLPFAERAVNHPQFLFQSLAAI